MNDTQPLFHCNMYTHLAVKQKLDIHYESSVARLARMGEGRMETEEDMKRCLGDRNGDLPIFRTEDRERDVLVTVATGTLKNPHSCLITNIFFILQAYLTCLKVAWMCMSPTLPTMAQYIAATSSHNQFFKTGTWLCQKVNKLVVSVEKII